MAPSIRVIVQVALLCCVVTTTMGGTTDWQKAYSQLENNMKMSQEEIKSLHKIIGQLEKRLEQLETKGELRSSSTACTPYHSYLLVRTILLL